jgi:hypothetical protein
VLTALRAAIPSILKNADLLFHLRQQMQIALGD